MYIPKFNEETRLDVLHGLIESQPLATLVTMSASGLFATHLPMVLDRSTTPYGTLRCHISRANTQWRDLTPSIDALAIFSGTQHYITPSWYPEKAEHARVVPTWNYATVHAYGPITIIEDPAWLLAHLNALTTQHEASFSAPWKVADAPADYIASQVKGIVGIELPIRRIEGKWKVSQNKSERTRSAIERGLEDLNTPESLAMRDLVNGKRP
ncbi:FMN-binding negative transcriptional regulator [Edaphobacter bradus]|uniref:FMN-binding negative transcriptional regulator n=1 Tax=Edaphobacter bradus TaxID=2259016 RepID=UPI0021DF6614|nr:FMN-binding negative transcriptional regulator [Edaphobacter bradus]